MAKKFDSYDVFHLCSFSGGTYKVVRLHIAQAFCKNMATSHYENFPVASVLLPANKRQDIFNIYAFARTADDVADTLLEYSTEERIALLESYLNNLRYYVSRLDVPMHNRKMFNPVLFACAFTIRKLNLPLAPFERLIKAFEYDSDFRQADTIDDLMRYCELSANPVGEIILRVFELDNEERIALSDAICSGLQLANFWQDFSVDLPNQRCFIPKQILAKHGMGDTPQNEWAKHPNFPKVLNELYDYTDALFTRGKALIKQLKPRRLRIEIALTLRGGRLILRKTRKLRTKILTQRPKISKLGFAIEAIKALFD